jgi:multidrug resistance efflux pump
MVGKQRAELERRDAAKAQEVARLQQSVQERARALKVAELELARLKARAPPAGSTGTGTNVVVQRPAPAQAAPSKAAPPSDGDEAWQKLVDELDKP